MWIWCIGSWLKRVRLWSKDHEMSGPCQTTIFRIGAGAGQWWNGNECPLETDHRFISQTLWLTLKSGHTYRSYYRYVQKTLCCLYHTERWMVHQWSIIRTRFADAVMFTTMKTIQPINSCHQTPNFWNSFSWNWFPICYVHVQFNSIV